MILQQWKSRRCRQILFPILRKGFIIPFVRRQAYLELPVIQLAVTVQLLRIPQTEVLLQMERLMVEMVHLMELISHLMMRAEMPAMIHPTAMAIQKNNCCRTRSEQQQITNTEYR